MLRTAYTRIPEISRFSTESVKAPLAQNIPKERKLPVLGMSLNPYVLFVKENFDGKNGKNTQAIRDLSEAWKNLSIAEKKIYKKKSEDYRKERIAEFLKLSEEDQKQKIEESKAQKLEKAKRRERKAKREEWKENGHPKIPPTAFAIYIKNQVEQAKNKGEKVTSVTEFMKNEAKKWRNMTEDERKIYLNKASTLNEEYRAELKKWKEAQTLNQSESEKTLGNKRNRSPAVSKKFE